MNSREENSNHNDVIVSPIWSERVRNTEYAEDTSVETLEECSTSENDPEDVDLLTVIDTHAFHHIGCFLNLKEMCAFNSAIMQPSRRLLYDFDWQKYYEALREEMTKNDDYISSIYHVWPDGKLRSIENGMRQCWKAEDYVKVRKENDSMETDTPMTVDQKWVQKLEMIIQKLEIEFGIDPNIFELIRDQFEKLRTRKRIGKETVIEEVSDINVHSKVQEEKKLIRESLFDNLLFPEGLDLPVEATPAQEKENYHKRSVYASTCCVYTNKIQFVYSINFGDRHAYTAHKKMIRKLGPNILHYGFLSVK